MKRFLKRIHRGNKGFTLIELLIVIAILGILAAVVVPNVIGFIGRGEEAAADAELVTIQTAMDSMMVDKGIVEITADTVGTLTNDTNNMAIFPGATSPLYPDYLRTQYALYKYTCTTTGLVEQGAKAE